MTDCTVYPYPGSAIPCGRPAIAHVEYGCIHEHIGAVDACDRCLRVRLLANEDTLNCTRCRKADGHGCRMLIKVTDLAEVTPCS